MKILIVSQYFWPEEFRVNDIAKGLVEKGHEVEVLTGVPNYPSGKKLKGFSLMKKTHKDYEGIKVYRTPMITRGSGSNLKLMLNYISFMIFGLFRIIPLLLKKYDKIFMFETSPITAAVPAMFLSKVRGIESTIYVQDLWPETFYSIVPLNNAKVKKGMDKFCMWIYNSFDKILIASKGYKEILMSKSIEEKKIIYFPQWAEDFYGNTYASDAMMESEVFNITFAGNIGKAQDVETLVKAMNYIKSERSESKIMCNIIGDGSNLEKLKKMVKDFNLSDNIKFLGRKPPESMPEYFSKSDALVVTLGEEYILKVTLPAKIQSYMASKKPIIGCISGEGKSVIEESICGYVAESGDFEKLGDTILKMSKLSKEQLNELGENGLNYFKDNFTRAKLLNKLDNIFSYEL